MRRRRRGVGSRGSTVRSLVSLCVALSVGLLLLGSALPAASFSQASVPRGTGVNVTADDHGAVTLDRANAVYVNDTSTLVNVTNRLGREVTVTVTLRSDSTGLGDLVVDGVDEGNETSFRLADGATKPVSIRIPDNSSLTDDVVYFHVTASGLGVTARAPDRSVVIR